MNTNKLNYKEIFFLIIERSRTGISVTLKISLGKHKDAEMYMIYCWEAQLL